LSRKIQLFGAILDSGFWPPASPSSRLYEPEAGGAIRPTLRPVSPWPITLRAGSGPGGIADLLNRFALSFFIKIDINAT